MKKGREREKQQRCLHQWNEGGEKEETNEKEKRWTKYSSRLLSQANS